MNAPGNGFFRQVLARRDCLTPFEEAGVLDALDVELARRLCRLSGRAPADLQQPDPAVWTGVQLEALAAAMASRAPAHGHICFDVRTAAGTSVQDPEAEPEDEPVKLPWPEDVSRWLSVLRSGSVLIRRPDSSEVRPLVLDDADRLYLDRYWRYELCLAGEIGNRIAGARPDVDEVELRCLGAELRLLLPDAVNPDPRKRDRLQRGIDGQRYGAFVSCLNRFTVLSGGPGTGKTSTVAVLVLLLMRQRERRGGPLPRILLVAPTGKAAARMQEAIRKEVEHPERGLLHRVRNEPDAASWTGLLAALQALEAGTIHRTLAIRPDEPTRPRYHRDNPLPADLVIVDEASMVDFALMTRLVEAVPREARLILLGDRDQLASVEAGAVLADVCVRPGSPPPVSPWLAGAARACLSRELAVSAEGPALRDCVANLEVSFRFDAPGIVELARAMRDHEVHAAFEIIGCLRPGVAGTGSDSVQWLPLAADADLAGEAGRALREAVVARWTAPGRDGNRCLRSVSGVLKEMDAADKAGNLGARKDLAKEALGCLDRVRVLCTHRKGPRGVETLNRLVRDWVRGALPGAGDWFEGQPILILRNDYHVRLFNGDVGLVLRDPFAGDLPAAPTVGMGEDGSPADDAVSDRTGARDTSRLVAVFPDSGPGPGIRAFPRGRLPPYETVFAMTIHKSQGSQFDHVAVLLPARDSDFVTRELVYTGITRASHRVTLAGDAGILRASLNRRVQRASGLRGRLWGDEPVADLPGGDDLPEERGTGR